MITRRLGFNLYLLAVLAGLACGCQSPEKKREKQVTTLAMHLEVNQDNTVFSRTIAVFRAKPVEVTVDRSPFLTEAEVASAAVVGDQNGWSLQLRLNERGKWLLEQYSTANPGRHMAIFSTFGPENKESRWLGAPLLNRRNSSGILQFTPDASREEAEEIAFGLNNLARQVAEKSKW
ncbi:MAG TPA: hypothetical protein VEH04_17565 [Verrucomicrobiae bacterium]|nr:hypothetical protein [Verrucomicrobiae bacterium]